MNSALIDLNKAVDTKISACCQSLIWSSVHTNIETPDWAIIYNTIHRNVFHRVHFGVYAHTHDLAYEYFK